MSVLKEWFALTETNVALITKLCYLLFDQHYYISAKTNKHVTCTYITNKIFMKEHVM